MMKTEVSKANDMYREAASAIVFAGYRLQTMQAVRAAFRSMARNFTMIHIGSLRNVGDRYALSEK